MQSASQVLSKRFRISTSHQKCLRYFSNHNGQSASTSASESQAPPSPAHSIAASTSASESASTSASQRFQSRIHKHLSITRASTSSSQPKYNRFISASTSASESANTQHPVLQRVLLNPRPSTKCFNKRNRITKCTGAWK